MTNLQVPLPKNPSWFDVLGVEEDDIKDKEFVFEGIKDLSELAIGSGFGLRYDFDFFVLRFDTGFKTYNPSLEKNERWLTEFSLNKAVFNIGINYPF